MDKDTQIRELQGALANALEALKAKANGEPVNESNAWNEPAIGGLFRKSTGQEVGRPISAETVQRSERVEISPAPRPTIWDDPDAPTAKRRGDDEVGPTGLTRRQIREIDAQEQRQRTAKHRRGQSLTDAILSGKKVRGQ
jgi:hypothetical protein